MAPAQAGLIWLGVPTCGKNIKYLATVSNWPWLTDMAAREGQAEWKDAIIESSTLLFMVYVTLCI